MAHFEVITQTADGFTFSPPLTQPEAKRYMAEMERQGNHMFMGKVYELAELVEMGCSGRGCHE